MEGKNKYSRTGLPGFIRYIGNNLTGREMNSFERELQKDPFGEDAEEGLSAIGHDALRKDMEVLSGRMKKRTTRRNRIILYRIAASIGVLMTISTVYILLNRSEDNKSAIEVQPLEISRSEPVKARKEEEVPGEKNPQLNQDEAKVKMADQALAAGQIAENKSRKIMPDTIKKEEKISLPEMAVSDNLSNVAPVVPMSRSISQNKVSREIRGKVISAEDLLPLPGATVTIKGTTLGTISDENGDFRLTLPEKSEGFLVASYIGMVSKEMHISGDSVLNVTLNPSTLALSEVVVVGYGQRKSADRTSNGAATKIDLNNDSKISDYTSPVPDQGKENFEKYITENIHKPDILKSGDKAVVVLSFIVRENGIPDSIKVVKSPGLPFSDEAIRLLRAGPRWKPATEKGVPVEAEARIRIVFK